LINCPRPPLCATNLIGQTLENLPVLSPLGSSFYARAPILGHPPSLIGNYLPPVRTSPCLLAERDSCARLFDVSQISLASLKRWHFFSMSLVDYLPMNLPPVVLMSSGTCDLPSTPHFFSGFPPRFVGRAPFTFHGRLEPSPTQSSICMPPGSFPHPHFLNSFTQKSDRCDTMAYEFFTGPAAAIAFGDHTEMTLLHGALIFLASSAFPLWLFNT